MKKKPKNIKVSTEWIDETIRARSDLEDSVHQRDASIVALRQTLSDRDERIRVLESNERQMRIMCERYLQLTAPGDPDPAATKTPFKEFATALCINCNTKIVIPFGGGHGDWLHTSTLACGKPKPREGSIVNPPM